MPKILIFEDDLLLAGAYKTKFELSGFEVALFNDGAEPVKRVVEEQPDIILSDVMMPVINGFQVGKLLKADHRTMNIPLVYCTTLGQPEDIAKGRAIGAVEYLVKGDYTPSDIVNYIKEILGLPSQPVETIPERVKKGRRWLDRLLGRK